MPSSASTRSRFLWMAVTLAACGSPATDRPAWQPNDSTMLLAMARSDQEARHRLAAVLSNPADSARARHISQRVDSLDREHTALLQSLVEERGWPSRDDVGSSAAGAIFLLVQHADHNLALQKDYLAFLRAEHAAGRAPGETVALLTDRVRQAQGLRQVFGTQLTLREGEVVLDPLEDSAAVDERRTELGLPPLQEYVEQVKAAYGVNGSR